MNALASRNTMRSTVQVARPAFSRPAVTRRAPVVVRASQKQASSMAALPAAIVVGAASMMASPLMAQAAVTPSLRNFLYSLLAGATVLAGIAGAVTVVSNFDPVSRE
eukprot:CAMPEP_0119103608 /NCGR_PEP_ID=MMETSP1180-20130426/2013_1 /TAXON_ID=3052 ORGANISM="Chlamydomonas cf sp, Strain CCMP681" /NCGR_SAMPLE_ID=MMETSP1180 /ASSEMBLY_ACC=CAM_ASM_000741 /LENGTH=106 /DNA_ID=CAMNT_0007088159 /DNA_START=57 /DNA_END=377 /DNA_ORIENTATION=+